MQTGQSFWLGKTREQLSAEAAARAGDMSRTAIGRSVPGRINEL